MTNNDIFDKQIEELLKGKKYTEAEINGKIQYINKHYPNVTIKRVCSYGRVSTKSDEQESSLFTQNSIFHSVCDNNLQKGWVLVEEVYDQKSATLITKRKKFLYIIEKAKQGYFNILLFKDSKRFSRNIEDFLKLIEELKRLGVYVVFISEGVSSENATREQLAMLGMMSEAHSNGLHHSVMNAKLINMNRDAGRIPPNTFGYDKPAVRDSSIAYINEKEAELIREMFTRLANLEGYTSISDDWKARGIKSKRGNLINSVNIKRMARNKLYIGILEQHRSQKQDVRSKRVKTDQSEWIVKNRPDLQIVDTELFYKVQEIMDYRRDNGSYNNPAETIKNRMLTGKITCQQCGKYYVRVIGRSGVKYFACAGHKQWKRFDREERCSNSVTLRQDELFKCFTLYFEQLINKQDDIKRLVKERINYILKNNKSENDFKVDAEDIKVAKEKLDRAKELYIEGLVSKSELEKYKNSLKDLETIHGKNGINAIGKVDVDKVVETFIRNLRTCLEIGISEDSIDGVAFNNLFESIYAEDGIVEINFKAMSSWKRFGVGYGKPPSSNLERYEGDIHIDVCICGRNALIHFLKF